MLIKGFEFICYPDKKQYPIYPSESGVYIICIRYKGNIRIKYIGSTNNLKRRMAGSTQLKEVRQLADGFTSVEVLFHKASISICVIEKLFISHFKPIMNQHLANNFISINKYNESTKLNGDYEPFMIEINKIFEAKKQLEPNIAKRLCLELNITDSSLSNCLNINRQVASDITLTKFIGLLGVYGGIIYGVNGKSYHLHTINEELLD